MNILVLGGAGYVGCVLVPELVSRGHQIKVIDWGAFTDGIGYIASLPVDLIQWDTRRLSDEDFVGQDIVVDLAAISNDPASELDAAVTWDVNCHARRDNALRARRAGVERYILASSCSVYGIVKEGEIADEGTPPKPQTVYAESAIEAERLVASQHPASFILRQATLYGVSKRMRWDVVVNKWARDLYQKSPLFVYGRNAWRPFLHVRDTVSVINLLINGPKTLVSGKPYNIVGENYRMDHLEETILQEFGGVWQGVMGNPLGDSRSYQVSGKKLQDVLNWYPCWTVLDGIREIHDALRGGAVDPGVPTTLAVYREFLRCYYT